MLLYKKWNTDFHKYMLIHLSYIDHKEIQFCNLYNVKKTKTHLVFAINTCIKKRLIYLSKTYIYLFILTYFN